MLRIGVVAFSVGVLFIALASTYVYAAIGAALIGSATGMTDASMNIMVVWARRQIWPGAQCHAFAFRSWCATCSADC